MTIGKTILELRKKHKISQEKLAEILGVTRQTLSNYENDITSPDLLQSKKICEVFDVSLDELIGNNNTISSKISSTERLVKNQNKTTKKILLILYLIIMLFLIISIIYMLTNNDFTRKNQVEFNCYSRSDRDYKLSLYLEGDYLSFDANSSFKDEDVLGNIVMRICEGRDNNCENETIMYAGKSVGEAYESVMAAKKILTDQGFVCR